MSTLPRLQEHYSKKLVPQMMDTFKYSHVLSVPRLSKITLNMGIGEAKDDKKHLTSALNDMAAISGQKASTTRARKSVASFKLREGMAIGCKVTLRGKRMYEFLDRLITIALPRVRDFHGVSPKGFDGRGNYSLGIREHIIFPEIDYDRVDKIRGLDVTIVTTANTDKEGKALLAGFKLPFDE